MKFSNLKIGVRLAVGFVIVLALSIMVGVFSMSRLAMVNAATADVATNWLPATRALGDYRSAINAIRRLEAQHVMSNSEEQFQKWERAIGDAKAQASAAMNAYTSTVTTDEEHTLLNEIKSAEQGYYAAQVSLLKLSSATDGVNDELRAAYNGTSRDALAVLLSAVEKDVAFQVKGADAAYKASQEQYASTRIAVIALLTVAVAIGSAMALVITRSISIPVAKAVKLAEAVAIGDLTSKIEADSADEVGQLLRALMRMNGDLSMVVSKVRSGSESVASASTQIEQGNQDLSGRTESQASALEETSAAMEELSSTVNQNADSARQANQLAISASTVAERGGQVVSEVVETMKDINDASKKIADIISVIDGIAFQTNILALNAAVEAARAGEQGRGFAVVASEVRSLAGRSAEAAKEIKLLIGASVERVERGSTLVDVAGSTMAEVVTAIKRVTDLMAEISAASNEQAAGVNQVGEAVQQMDQDTQQNAALVEEMAAAAMSLRAQADDLVTVVSVFKIDASAPREAESAGRQYKASAKPAAKTQKAVAVKGAGARLATTMPARKLAMAGAGEGDWETF